MLLKRHFERLLLSPADLRAAARRFRGRRGVQSRRDPRRTARSSCWCAWPSGPAKSAPGMQRSPRWSPGVGLEIDWLADDEIEVLDPRVVKRKADGLVRLTFISHLRVVRCGDGRSRAAR